MKNLENEAFKQSLRKKWSETGENHHDTKLGKPFVMIECMKDAVSILDVPFEYV